MADNDFEKLLARQAENPNFLAGAITAGAAKLMSDRTEATSRSLNKFNQSLQLIEDEPMTTAEQVEKLEGDAGVRDEIKSITQQAQDYQALSQNIIDRKEKYSQVFDQALTELALIGGPEAQRLAQTLQGRKAGVLGRLDEQAEMPARLLKFQNLVTQTMMGQDQYDKWLTDRDYAKDVAVASDLILNDEEFGDIKGGDVNTWSEKELDDFTERQKRIINRVSQQAKEQGFSPAVVSDAFNITMQRTGKSFRYNKLNPIVAKQLAQMEKASELEKQMLPTVATMYSDMRRSLNPKMLEWARQYSVGDVLPSADELTNAGYEKETVKLVQDRIKGLARIFGTDGEYNKIFTRLTSLYPDVYATDEQGNFKNFKDVKLGGTGSMRLPDDPRFRGIDIPGSFNTWSTGKPYLYDTAQYMKLQGIQEGQYDDLMNTGLDNQTVDPFSRQAYGMIQQVPVAEATSYIIEDIMRDFGGIFNLQMSPDIRPRVLSREVERKREELEGQ